MVTSPSVCILCSEFPPGPGGIGTHALQLARNLSSLGWNVSVVTRQDYVSEDESRQFNRTQDFSIMRLHPMPSVLTELGYRIPTIIKHLRDTKCDLIIASGERMVWLCALLAPIHRLPWIAVGHGSEFTASAKWQSALTRWSFNAANAVVCVSNYTRQKMLDLGIMGKLQAVIHNGADDAVFYKYPPTIVEEYRNAQGWDDERLLLTVGRVCDRKGQETVIRALPTVLAEFENVHYVMAGLAEEEERLSALAVSLGITNHVHFLGRIATDQLPILMNASEIFVMLSRQTAPGDIEGYGIAVVEAALCGIPAVVSRDSGLVEAIEPHVTGLAVSHDDVSQVSEALLYLFRDTMKREMMGNAARERAVREQKWESVVVHYDKLMRSLLKLPVL